MRLLSQNHVSSKKKFRNLGKHINVVLRDPEKANTHERKKANRKQQTKRARTYFSGKTTTAVAMKLLSLLIGMFHT